MHFETLPEKSEIWKIFTAQNSLTKSKNAKIIIIF